MKGSKGKGKGKGARGQGGKGKARHSRDDRPAGPTGTGHGQLVRNLATAQPVLPC